MAPSQGTDRVRILCDAETLTAIKTWPATVDPADDTSVTYTNGDVSVILNLDSGSVTWYSGPSAHRDNNLPARWVGAGGRYRWLREGAMHREQGPAFVHPSKGAFSWLLEGIPHRSDGPARVDPAFYQMASMMWMVGSSSALVSLSISAPSV